MVSTVISAIALIVSLVTAWLTLFRKGKLRMTRPSLVGFLFELPEEDPKIFFRAMLYATGKRGHIIEGLYLKVRHRNRSQVFSFWMYGETKSLLIGSGLRVPEDGISSNHHFLPPRGEPRFEFLPGEYLVEVWTTVVNLRKSLRLRTISLSLSSEQAAVLRDKTNCVLFTWGPESEDYRAEISTGASPSLPR